MTDAATNHGLRLLELLERTLAEITDPQKSLAEIVRDNKRANESHHELQRMHAALKTYLDTDPRLRYVALVGAFSSGKTATINNLVDVAGTDQARPEDTDPVDEKLTLCAHRSNEESLLATLLKSHWDTDKFFHHADALSDIIFVDTPGSGDPKVRTDIVHNFLPICDTVVYCFNATNPLNSNDLPILRELNEVLQHTDFFYVYTRADNVYKKSENKPLTPDNFDEEKALRQRDTFVARLTEALSHVAARPAELFFIGNTNKFGVDLLKKRILAPPGDVTTLGLQKLGFFRARTIESLETLLSVIREQSVTVRQLVDRAEENHREYNAKFEIRTEEIKEFWRGAQKALSETLARYKEVEVENCLSSISSWAIERLALRDTKPNSIERFGANKLQSLSRELDHLAQQEFGTWKRDLSDLIYADGLEMFVSPLRGATLTKSLKTALPVADYKNDFFEQAQEQLRGLFTTLLDNFVEQIKTHCKDYRSDFGRALRHATTAELFDVERQLYEQCSRQIHSAIELYASLIDLYVSGINAAGTMLLIERAHLAKDIDFLQREKVSDRQKSETTINLIGEIFGASRQALGQIEQKCSLCPLELKKWASECEALSNEANDFRADISHLRLVPDLASLAPIWEVAIQPLVSCYEAWQEAHRSKIALLLNKRYDEASAEFDADKSRVTSAWKKRIWRIGVLGGILIILFAVGYYKFDPKFDPDSARTAIILAAAGEALWTFVVWMFGKIRWDNRDWFLKSRKKIFQFYSLKAVEEIRHFELHAPDRLVEVHDECRVRLNDALLQLVGRKSEEFRQLTEPSIAQIEKVRDAGAQTIAAYRREWENARGLVDTLYQETNDKVEKFKAVATTFKERTMDRTRRLFGDRGATLDGYARVLEDCVASVREWR